MYDKSEKPVKDSDMAHLDRLSVLFERFSLRVTTCHEEDANMVIYEDSECGSFTRLVLSKEGSRLLEHDKNEVAAVVANASLGGGFSLLFSTLPDRIELTLTAEPGLSNIATLLRDETRHIRCGGGAVRNRLGEVLVVRLFRRLLEEGVTTPGLLNGLADDRLSKALVEIHTDPTKKWSIQELAEVSGLSLSRFSELFQEKIGISPMAYLRRWRMSLARQDLTQGERIQTVAHRYCYGSGDALARAIKKEFGTSAKSLKGASPPVHAGHLKPF